MLVKVWLLKATNSLISQLDLYPDEARQEARSMLEEVCHWTWAEQIKQADQELIATDRMRLDRVLARRLEHEPLTSIFDRAYFYGRKFSLNRACLAPRPETELLVDWALELLGTEHFQAKEKIRLAEFCAGSGAPGLSLLAELQERGRAAELLVSDISPTALEAARTNALNLDLAAYCSFAEADLFPRGQKGFDIILVNPPYIPSADLPGLMPEVRCFEPALALDGGCDGLDFYRRLARGIRPYLLTDGYLLLEHGVGQRVAIREIFNQHNLAQSPAADKSSLPLNEQRIHISCRDDYAGIDRLIAVSYA